MGKLKVTLSANYAKIAQMNKVKSSLNWLKKTYHKLSKMQVVFLALGAVLLGGILVSAFNSPEIETIGVERGDIVEEVLSTGKTKSSVEVNLGFERSGKVVTNNISVGDRVTEGQTLVVIDQSDLIAKLRKAEATLHEAELDLSNTVRGSVAGHSSAVNTLVASIKDAYVTSDDAVRNNADQFFDDPRTIDARFNPSFSDGSSTFFLGVSIADKNLLSKSRQNLEKVLVSWEASLSLITTENVDGHYSTAVTNLKEVQKFLDEISRVINSLNITDLAYEATLRTYRTNISTSRSSVSSAISALLTAKQDFDTAPALATGTGVYTDVLSAQARIDGLEADILAIKSDLSRTVLTAPVSGIVTRADAKRGEIVTSGTTLVSIISESDIRIEANVSEINISKVKVGDKVYIELDALANETLEGKVVYIDPGETLVDSVPTYKVTIAFDELTVGEIRSGLTANLRIVTAEREGVLKIPAYALIRKDGKTFVKVYHPDREEEREVRVGLRGTDGSVEVLAGLTLEDLIIFTK
jgi:RND family efflux transporter MFP subunit